MSKVVCPHCRALMKSANPLSLGMQVHCPHCRAPFAVSAADLVQDIPLGGSHVGIIQVPASLAEEQRRAADGGIEDEGVVPENASGSFHQPTPLDRPAMGIPEVSHSHRTAPLPLTAHHSPPPTKNSQVATALPYAPPPSSRQGALMALVLGGFLLFLGTGGVLAWYCLSESPSDVEKTAFHEELPHWEKQVGPSSNENKSNENQEAAKPSPVPKELKKEPTPVPFPELPAKFAASAKPQAAKQAGPPGVATPGLTEQQKRVNEAIERGVRFLKANQLPGGSWIVPEDLHAVGYAALPGLTLLECQVSPGDPVVQKAAHFVRRQALNLNQTYDLALAILFLDRLGERGDRGLIQKLALRLVAGQTDKGGWNYDCPLITLPEMSELMLFLHQTRPKTAQLLNPIPTSNQKLTNPLPQNDPGPANPLQKGKNGLLDPLPGKSKEGSLPNPLIGPGKTEKGKDPKLIARLPAAGDKARNKVPPKEELGRTRPKVPPRDPLFRANRPGPFKLDLPVPQWVKANKPHARRPAKPFPGKGMRFRPGRDDNSNSQFAMLALWTARRHDVPTETTLARADKRYRKSQNPDGGWGYQIGMGTANAMTGVGLLGLAMGHGSSEQGLLLAFEARAKKNAPRNLLEDPAILKGLQAFGRFIGTPLDSKNNPAIENLYFLWTVERVAMLYNLKTIGNKDWYGWGVNILLPNQGPDGSWYCKRKYPGSNPTIDTCFALLFLKRSNLVQDLTDNLSLYLAIVDPESGRSRSR